MTVTVQQLRVAKSFLRQAILLESGVRESFDDGERHLRARLAEIELRCADEAEYIDRLAAKIERRTDA
jgi:hypothetical protein